MEDSYGRYSRNALSSQLGQLLSLHGVDIDETVHISNAEALDIVTGSELPLRTESLGMSDKTHRKEESKRALTLSPTSPSDNYV
jgi:hypothetical protein